MKRRPWTRGFACAFALMITTLAHADLTGAQKAYAAKEYERAFALFRELAEIGNLTAQENLAAMYVDGEGVRRDNVMGYAWASIARENGGGAVMQNIIDQLKPHLNDAARARVAGLTEIFGVAALKERLLPGPDVPTTPNQAESCRMSRPANPDDSYPPGIVQQGISGSVLVDAPVEADGRTHHPIVLYSLPQGAFENAARANAFANGFAPKKVNGAVVPCSIRYKVKYRVKNSSADAALDTALDKARVVAEAGDPVGQALYGLLLMDRGKSGADPREWFLKSAQAGVPFAQYIVGATLLVDRSPEGEVRKGLTWLRMAAATGDPDARFALANYALNHVPDATTDPVVFAWLEDAANANHRDATLALAALLAAGPDAKRRDPARALELIAAAKWDFDFDPTAQEAIAAAEAQLGRFDKAQDAQKRAIKIAKGYGWNTAPLDARLAGYQKNTAWSGNLLGANE